MHTGRLLQHISSHSFALTACPLCVKQPVAEPVSSAQMEATGSAEFSDDFHTICQGYLNSNRGGGRSWEAPIRTLSDRFRSRLMLFLRKLNYTFPFTYRGYSTHVMTKRSVTHSFASTGDFG